MITANWAANQTQKPATPQTAVASRPQGAGVPACGVPVGSGADGGAEAKGSWLIRALCQMQRWAIARTSSRFTRRRFGRALTRQRHDLGTVAHRPLAETVAAAAFGEIDMHMVL